MKRAREEASVPALDVPKSGMVLRKAAATGAVTFAGRFQPLNMRGIKRDTVPPLQPDFAKFVSPVQLQRVALQRSRAPANKASGHPDQLVVHDSGRNVTYTGTREDTSATYAVLVPTEDDKDGKPVYDVVTLDAFFNFERDFMVKAVAVEDMKKQWEQHEKDFKRQQSRRHYVPPNMSSARAAGSDDDDVDDDYDLGPSYRDGFAKNDEEPKAKKRSGFGNKRGQQMPKESFKELATLNRAEFPGQTGDAEDVGIDADGRRSDDDGDVAFHDEESEGERDELLELNLTTTDESESEDEKDGSGMEDEPAGAGAESGGAPAHAPAPEALTEEQRKMLEFVHGTAPQPAPAPAPVAAAPAAAAPVAAPVPAPAPAPAPPSAAHVSLQQRCKDYIVTFLTLKGGRASSDLVKKEIRRLIKQEGTGLKQGLVDALSRVARSEKSGGKVTYILRN